MKNSTQSNKLFWERSHNKVIFIATTLIALVMVSFISVAPTAAQNIIAVQSDLHFIASDGICSLNEAIINANDDAQTHTDCAAGSGADILDIQIDFIQAAFSYANYSGATAAPAITTDITIQGNGGVLSGMGRSTRTFYVDSTGTLTLENMTLSDVDSSTLWGGAIYVATGGTLNVLHTTFADNTADRAGAIWSYGNVVIANSTFSNNTVSENGGAIIGNENNNMLIVNSTFWGNVAGSRGGAIYSARDTSQIDLHNVTMTNNSATVAGGGFRVNFGVINLYNAIISGNTSTNGSAECSDNNTLFAAMTAKNNVFGTSNNAGGCTGFAAATSANNVVPTGDISTILVSAAGVPILTGSPTQTVELAPGSPAINAGDNSLLPSETTLGLDIDGSGTLDSPIPIDQIGNDRIARSVVDSGAHESYCGVYSGFYYNLGTVDSNLVNDLRQAIECNNVNPDGYDFGIDMLGQTVTFTDSYGSAADGYATALPEVTRGLVLVNGTLERNTTDAFRFIYNNTTGGLDHLYIDRVTFNNGGGRATFGGDDFAGDGGALAGQYMTITNSTFDGNLTNANGGAIATVGAEVTIANVTFVNNYAAGDGGAVHSVAANAANLIVNSTFIANQTPAGSFGGALYLVDGTHDVINNTIVQNDAGFAGGIYIDSNATVELHNNIVSLNTSDNSAGNCSGIFSETNATFNIVGHDSLHGGCANFNTASGNITLSGALSTLLETDTSGNAVLADNGGETETINLVFDSPAVNAGDNSLIPAENRVGFYLDQDGDDGQIDIDQNGNLRTEYGTVDIGAVEFTQCNELGYGSTVLLGQIETDLVTDLRQAIVCANFSPADEIIDLQGQTVTFTNNYQGTLTATPVIDLNGHLTIRNGTLTRSGNNSFRFIQVTVPRANQNPNRLTLDGMTLTNGGGSLMIDQNGGAMWSTGHTTIINSTFSDNGPSRAGGAVSFSANDLDIRIINSTFSGNLGDWYGGALNVAGRAIDMKMINSTFVDNQTSDTSSFGGAMYFFIDSNSTIDMINNTIVDNVAITRGGGFWFHMNSSAAVPTMTLHNNIISGNINDAINHPFSYPNHDCGGSYNPFLLTTATYNIFGDGNNNGGCTGFATASNNTTPSGNLGTIVQTAGGQPVLADYGGPTQVVPLVLNSPAINSGDNAMLPTEEYLGVDVDGDGVISTSAIDVDQLGEARIQDAVVDAGSYEFVAPAATPTLTMYPDGSYDWTPDQSGCTESLYRSGTPYAGYAWLTDDPANYDGSGSLTSVETNYFYYLYVDCGSSTAQSDAVGEFTFAIVPGS
ncbi:MAG: hypothetical protein KC423_04850 [Anaerolineales bacterium]|nr:hypothetical protein [Anaerolineales bacterium]